MTQLGHVIIGISCGTLVSPSKLAGWARILLLSLFALFANAPDIAIKGWGHDKYYFSHSVFVSFGLICVLFAAWIILCSAFTTAFMQNPSINLLFGISKHHYYAIANTLEGVINLLLSLILVKYYGIYGVAFGTAIPMILLA